jgi:hypothetical protein
MPTVQLARQLGDLQLLVRDQGLVVEGFSLATASSAATRAALSRSASNAAFSASISLGRSSAAAAMPESNHKSRLLTRRKCSDLPGAPRSEGVARVPPINAVEHVGELRRRDGDRPVGR